MVFEPHPYQRYAISRILEGPNVGLFLDMGLGKTVITLTAIEELMYQRWAVCRVLIVAPKKVAEATWSAEAEKWEHTKKLMVVPAIGTEKKRIAALQSPADVYVINRENVPWLVEYYRHDWPFDMVVLDESSSFKNPGTRRFRSLRLVLPKIKRLVELTGTPAPNGLEDLWAQLYLLDGGERLGRTITSFRDAYFTQDRAYPGQTYRTYTAKPGAYEQVQDKISDICVSMKAEDYITLPDLIYHEIPVALDDKAAKAYKRLQKAFVLELDGAEITAQSAAVLNGKLLQLCSGSVYDSEGGVVQIHSCKLDALTEAVEGLHGEHTLVFYWYQHEAERIVERLSTGGRRVRVYQGAEDERAWNEGEVDVLLAHPVSCGYGLNLQEGGHHAIWYTLPNWNLEVYQQANKRLHRQGQTKPVILHHLLVKGGVDETVMKALNGKGDAQESILQAIKAMIEEVRTDGSR